MTCTLLTHLMVGYERERALRAALPEVTYEPWALFLGRLEAYKGLRVLVDAVRQIDATSPHHSITLSPPHPGTASPSHPLTPSPPLAIVAGPGTLDGRAWRDGVPPGIELRNRLIEDEEAVDLLRRCGLLVLPYVEASQSALIGAAYFFRKPVVTTAAGALPEYVVEGETGWLVPPDDPAALAGALSDALSDPARLARMGAAGRAWYERARAEETAALLEMYARVAGGEGERG